MPGIRIIIDRFPSGNAWKKRVHHRELLGFARELRGVGVRDHQPDVVSHHARLVDLQGTNQVMDLLRRAVIMSILLSAGIEESPMPGKSAATSAKFVCNREEEERQGRFRQSSSEVVHCRRLLCAT